MHKKRNARFEVLFAAGSVTLKGFNYEIKSFVNTFLIALFEQWTKTELFVSVLLRPFETQQYCQLNHKQTESVVHTKTLPCWWNGYSLCSSRTSCVIHEHTKKELWQLITDMDTQMRMAVVIVQYSIDPGRLIIFNIRTLAKRCLMIGRNLIKIHFMQCASNDIDSTYNACVHETSLYTIPTSCNWNRSCRNVHKSEPNLLANG